MPEMQNGRQSEQKSLLSQADLQRLVEQISLTFFNQPFRHQAIFNARLKTTGGRYHLASHNLDFNPKVWLRYGQEELENVIKHELCHYHLHLAGKGYQHKDQDFKLLLATTGGSRFVRPLVDYKEQQVHQYHCLACQAQLSRKRRINTTRYVCGRCGGKLELIEQ